MSRPPIPGVIADLLADHVSLRALGAACLAIAAAGLDPHVLDAGQRRMQAVMVEDPTSTMGLLAVAAVVQAGLLLAGGAAADLWRSVRLLRGALLGLVLASVAALLVGDGPWLVPIRAVAWACDGVIIPFAVGTVAHLYHGETRGTAIGVLLATYGAAGFLAPILLGVRGPAGLELAAFGLCVLLALIAFRATRDTLPALAPALPGQRLTVVTTAVWAFGVVVALNGLLQQEIGPILTGSAIILGALAVRRIRHAPRDEGVRARAGGAALAAGLVIGLSQSIPMFALPAFFREIRGMDPLLASVLLAPFVVGVLVAGPAAGLLLSRFTPRRLILAGVWAIAAADIAFYALLGGDTGPLVLILPFILVGAGFMVSTAVRTAVIFASTPKRFAGTAAALNEATIGMGTRLGVTMAVALQTGAIGFTDIEAIRIGLVTAGVVGLVGGIAIFFILGPHDPVRTMWDLRDERET